MSIFEKRFWRDTAERVISSAGQGFVLGLGGGAALDIVGTDIRYLPLVAALSNAGGMMALSFGKCLWASRVGDPESASLLRGGHAEHVQHVHVAQGNA